jgi:hypothetical protein
MLPPSGYTGISKLIGQGLWLFFDFKVSAFSFINVKLPSQIAASFALLAKLLIGCGLGGVLALR